VSGKIISQKITKGKIKAYHNGLLIQYWCICTNTHSKITLTVTPTMPNSNYTAVTVFMEWEVIWDFMLPLYFCQEFMLYLLQTTQTLSWVPELPVSSGVLNIAMWYQFTSTYVIGNHIILILHNRNWENQLGQVLEDQGLKRCICWWTKYTEKVRRGQTFMFRLL